MRRIILATAIVVVLAPPSLCCGWLGLGLLLDSVLVDTTEAP
jgi:hypothetical protein